MAAQTLDQVLASLQSVYQPQLDSIAKQQADLPAQYQAQEQGLNATKDQAFGDILNGARARGTGVAFGGIPLSEQAQYTASNYLPALANLKTSQNNASQSLIDAINKINENKFSTGNSLYQFGVQQDNAQQQLDEQKREFDAQQAAAARAAASAGSFNPTLTPSATPSNTHSQPTLSGNKSTQDAYNAVQNLLGTKDQDLIRRTYVAIADSARRGNTYDQAKVQLLNQLWLNQQSGAASKSSISKGVGSF